MNREYFCCDCGLFYWLPYSSHRVCPNTDCTSHTDEEATGSYSCDSMSFVYFSRDNKDFITEICWSSLVYAPESALEHYRKHGVLIKE